MEAPHRARKRFGQNFLHDPGIINKIIRAVSASSTDHLVEIGPGQGAITSELLASGATLDAVEIDRDLVTRLQQLFSGKVNFHIHQADALAFDFATLQQHDEKLRVVGNLPYNISTPLIFHLLKQQALIRDMHFMLQLEVVNRLAAVPGTKAYGRLSVMTQYYCQVEALFEVPPEAFNPKPKVTSAVVRLSPHSHPPFPAHNTDTLQSLLRNVFNQRRKTLRNTLKTMLSAEQMQALPVDLSARPETISLEQFVAISNHIDLIAAE